MRWENNSVAGCESSDDLKLLLFAMCIQFIMNVFLCHTQFLQEESSGNCPCKEESLSAEEGCVGSGQFRGEDAFLGSLCNT